MDMLDVVHKTLDIHNNRRLAEEAHTVYHPEVVLVSGNGTEVHGVDDVVTFNLGFLEALPDLHNELVDHDLSGDGGTITMDMSGTFTGEMKTPDGGTIPGTGKRAEWQSQAELEFTDGKISRWTTIVDMQDFMSQIGLG